MQDLEKRIGDMRKFASPGFNNSPPFYPRFNMARDLHATSQVRHWIHRLHRYKTQVVLPISVILFFSGLIRQALLN